MNLVDKIVTHNYEDTTINSLDITSENIINIINVCFTHISHEKKSNMSNTLEYILNQICSLINCDFGVIDEINATDVTQNNTYKYNSNLCIDIDIPFKSNHVINKYIFDNTSYINNKYCNECFKKHIDICYCNNENNYSIIAMPLIDNITVIGTLIFGRYNGQKFSKKDLSILQPFVQFISNTLSYLHNNEDIEMKKLNFIANMGHEVRTPLNAIISMIELLSNTELTVKQFEYINSLRTCGFQLMDILNDILDFSKIMNNGIKLKYEPMSINKCVHSVITMLNNKALEKDLPINHTIDNKIPDMVIGDSIRIKQILMNVLSNAIKFTKKGHIDINVQLVKEDTNISSTNNNNITILFTITDTGIGISGDKLSKIYDSFRQIENDYLNENCGVGLGLSITKHLVDLFNGTIVTESKIGIGTKVQIKLPLCIFKDNIDKTVLLEYFKYKNVLIYDTNIEERVSLFNIIAEHNLKPILTSSLTEILMYLSHNSFQFEFLLLNINDLTTNDIVKIQRVKNSAIKVIILDENSINNIYGYDYKLIRPVNNIKILELLNIIYTTHQYNTLRLHNEISIHNNIFKISNVNVNNQIVTEKLQLQLQQETLHPDKIDILIAEDNKYNQIVLCELLKSIGYKNITIVDDGLECLNKLTNHHYHVAFIDLKMPLLSGIDAVVQYKNTNPTNSPIIIAVTANIASEVKKKCFDNHMDGFITKPVDKGDLENVMRLIISNYNHSHNHSHSHK